MTFVKTGFAPNDRLSLEVKKRNGPACSGEAFLTLMAPILPAAPRSACGPPTGEQWHPERSPERPVCGQPARSRHALLSNAQAVMLTAPGGERLQALPPTCPARAGTRSLSGGVGSRRAVLCSSPGFLGPRREAPLIIPFTRAEGASLPPAPLPPLRGTFLAVEFMSCTFI